jgi:hypothetical protein
VSSVWPGGSGATETGGTGAPSSRLSLHSASPASRKQRTMTVRPSPITVPSFPKRPPLPHTQSHGFRWVQPQCFPQGKACDPDLANKKTASHQL